MSSLVFSLVILAFPPVHLGGASSVGLGMAAVQVGQVLHRVEPQLVSVPLELV